MRPHLVAALLSIPVAGCVPRYTRFREQDLAEFRRQDSSIVNRAVDELVRRAGPFRSLPQTGLTPKNIVVNRGDSAWLYHAYGVYLTFRLDRTPDACSPPSRMSFTAWKELASGTGVDAVELFAAGDTSGMRDTFSAAEPDCNGPMLTLHHPILAVGRVIDRQYRYGVRSTGKGGLQAHLSRSSRPCSAEVRTYLESQAFPGECRLAWMQVFINTRVGDRAASDTFFISAMVPAVHIWLDCRGPKRSHDWCPRLPPRGEPSAAKEYSPPLPPPPPARPPLVEVTGVIKDTEEGVPIPYSRARFANNLVVYADSNGRFTVQLPPGRASAMAECFGPGGGSSGQGQEEFRVRPYMAELAFFLSRLNCVRPPVSVRDSVFEGEYDPGLEKSRFTFCGNRGFNVWTVLTPQAEAERVSRLAARRGQEGFPGFIWKVRGSLEGPGRLGPNGTADYVLTVERVLEIRVSKRSECYR